MLLYLEKKISHSQHGLYKIRKTSTKICLIQNRNLIIVCQCPRFSLYQVDKSNFRFLGVYYIYKTSIPCIKHKTCHLLPRFLYNILFNLTTEQCWIRNKSSKFNGQLLKHTLYRITQNKNTELDKISYIIMPV